MQKLSVAYPLAGKQKDAVAAEAEKEKAALKDKQAGASSEKGGGSSPRGFASMLVSG